MICTFTNRFHLLGKIHLKSSCWFFIRGFIFFRRGRILLVISPDIWWYLINYLLEITSLMKFFFTKIREICALCQSFCSIWPVGWIILWKFNWNPRYQGTTITMYTLLMKATSRYTKYVLEKIYLDATIPLSLKAQTVIINIKQTFEYLVSKWNIFMPVITFNHAIWKPIQVIYFLWRYKFCYPKNMLCKILSGQVLQNSLNFDHYLVTSKSIEVNFSQGVYQYTKFNVCQPGGFLKILNRKHRVMCRIVWPSSLWSQIYHESIALKKDNSVSSLLADKQKC